MGIWLDGKSVSREKKGTDMNPIVTSVVRQARDGIVFVWSKVDGKARQADPNK